MLRNVSDKGSKEILHFICTKHCMVPGGWRIKEEEFCNWNHDLEVSFQFGLFIRNIKLALLLLQQGIKSQQNYIQA